MMRVLVYPHDLGIGGSQLNAIELAAAVRDQGHDVLLFGVPGPLLTRVRALGLEFVPAPPSRSRPGWATVRALRSLIKDRGVDIVHGYEWPPTIDLCLASAGTSAAPVSTVMSMAVAPFIPRGLPLVVGTEQIGQREMARGRSRVAVIEPPVDLSENDPAVDHGQDAFLAGLGVPPDAIVLVSVSRLAHELKLEGILTAIRVVASLPRQVQLIVVGDGPARPLVQAAAEEANRRAGRRAVLLTGELEDPRPAYACADVVLGMGGSALRALSFAKPLVVQGEQGFWTTLTPESLPTFLWQGWYGVGGSPEDGPRRLLEELQPLLAVSARRVELGAFGRSLAVERFSLTAAAERQVIVYERAGSSPPPTLGGSPPEACRAAGSYIAHGVRRKWTRRRAIASRDDFNARPEARDAREPSPIRGPEDLSTALEGNR
jgi:glycosyltransferase involved in cell wall biosynthesis